MANSSNVQAHDLFPREFHNGAFGSALKMVLPGLSFNAEYNYSLSGSTQLSSLQLDTLLHSGSHPWINRAIRQLEAEFNAFPDDVKTLRAAQFMNYLREAADPGNFNTPGSATNGFVAFTSRTDPRAIEYFGGPPTRAQMENYTRGGMSWDNIINSPSGNAVQAINPRIEGGVLKTDGIINNGGVFSRPADEIDDFRTFGAEGSRAASAEANAALRGDLGIEGQADGSIKIGNDDLDRQRHFDYLTQTEIGGRPIADYNKVSMKLFSKLGPIGLAASLVLVATSASAASNAQAQDSYTTETPTPANKAFLADLIGEVTGEITGIVAGALAGFASWGLLAIPAYVVIGEIGVQAGRAISNLFYDLFPTAANNLAESLADVITDIANGTYDLVTLVLDAIGVVFDYMADELTKPDGLFGVDGPLFGEDGPLAIFGEFLQNREILTEEGIWLWDGFDAILEGSEKDDVLIHEGWGEASGGKGNDVLLGMNPIFMRESDYLFEEPGSEAIRDDRLILDGGEGNDWVLTFGGEGAVTIGGEGRDWLFNTSRGGIIFGDTYSSVVTDIDAEGRTTAEPVDQTDYDNSDKIWFWGGTVMMDPGEQDYLAFYGIPLVGGSSGAPLWLSVRLGGLTLQNSQLFGFGGLGGIYLDEFLPFIMYVHDPEEKSLIVTNALTFGGTMLSQFVGIAGSDERTEGPNGESLQGHSMYFQNYDNFASGVVGWQLFNDQGQLVVGDLAMNFKRPSFFVGAGLELLGKVLGSTSVGWIASAGIQLFGILDLAYTVASTLIKIGKNVRWASFEDPLVLDLDGDGIETSQIREKGGIYFDHDGDYFKELTGWLDADDGFLALDKNGNGRIDDISELFGGVGILGTDELAQYDSNEDGVIDALDAVFSKLLVWRDFNQDGESQEDELSTLEDLGILNFDLNVLDLGVTTPQGTELPSYIRYNFADGAQRLAYNAIFEINQANTRFQGDEGLADWVDTAGLPNMRGMGTIADLGIVMSNDMEMAEIVARDAAAMTMPNLEALRQLASPTLSHWAQALSTSRELRPVLTETDAEGVVTLVDYGVYQEDASGGFWALNSGAPVLDDQGAPIARPTLEDILALTPATDSAWTLEQAFSPVDRGANLTERAPAPYLVELIDDRAHVRDYGIEQPDGSWALASGAPVLAEDGSVIAGPTRDDILNQAAADGFEWRVEDLQSNPYANIEVEHIGLYVVDQAVVDYTVEVTDEEGSFYLWARNLDRALELQEKFIEQGRTDELRAFNLRNFEVDFDTLDEVNSDPDSAFRVEKMTPGEFHFATSLAGIPFQPAMLSADVAASDGRISYSIDGSGESGFATIDGNRPIDAMIEFTDLA
ncbi:MAG: hypothetical protein AAF647_06810, partial [Pseudomonadota bacterium]